MSKQLLSVSLLFFSLLTLSGCGGTDFGEIGQISGKVTYKGKTVEKDTKVIFMRMDKGYAGFAFTDAEGNYKIEWRREGVTYDGLPIGDYKVLVEPPSVVQDTRDIEELSAEEMLEGKDEQLNRPVQKTDTFDPKYTKTATSGLEYKISPGKNLINLDLK